MEEDMALLHWNSRDVKNITLLEFMKRRRGQAILQERAAYLCACETAAVTVADLMRKMKLL
jgi:hypothetical protein